MTANNIIQVPQQAVMPQQAQNTKTGQSEQSVKPEDFGKLLNALKKAGGNEDEKAQTADQAELVATVLPLLISFMPVESTPQTTASTASAAISESTVSAVSLTSMESSTESLAQQTITGLADSAQTVAVDNEQEQTDVSETAELQPQKLTAEQLAARIENHPVLSGRVSASDNAVENVWKNKIANVTQTAANPEIAGKSEVTHENSGKSILVSQSGKAAEQLAVEIADITVTTSSQTSTSTLASNAEVAEVAAQMKSSASPMLEQPVSQATDESMGVQKSGSKLSGLTDGVEVLPETAKQTSTTSDNSGSQFSSEDSQQGKSFGAATESSAGFQSVGQTQTYSPVSTVDIDPIATPKTEIPAASEQIAQTVTTGLKNGETSIVMHLKPEGLGNVTVKMLSDGNGGLTLNLTSSNEQTVKLLQNQIGDLRTSLESQNLNITKVSAGFESSTNADLLHSNSADVWSGQQNSQSQNAFEQFAQYEKGQQNEHRSQQSAYVLQQASAVNAASVKSYYSGRVNYVV